MGKNVWKPVKKALVAFSVGLNLAFGTIWLMHSLSDRTAGQERLGAVDRPAEIPSSIHREIGVTPEQWEQIEPMIAEFREKTRHQRQIIRGHREQLLVLLNQRVTDETAIRSEQENILFAQRQMQDLVITHLLREKEILTPEQAKKLVQAIVRQCSYPEEAKNSRRIGHVLEDPLNDSTQKWNNNKENK